MTTSLKMLLAVALPALLHLSSASAADTSDTDSDSWHYVVGLGVNHGPTYPGADGTRFRAFPVLGASYGRYFIGAADGAGAGAAASGVGAYLYRDQHWKTGIALGYDINSPRKESVDETHLHGLGDIDRAAHASLFARYSDDGLSLNGAVITSSGGQGLQFKLGSEMSMKLSPTMRISAGPSLTWSSAKSNQTFFGVNSQQSANSGLRQYSASAGISDVTFGVGFTYMQTPSWSIGSRLSTSYIPSSVNDSPIVEKPASVSYSIFTGYRF